MTIMKVHEQWRPECEVALYPHQVLTEDNNIEYWTTKKLWNQSHVEEFEFLSCVV